MTLVTPPALRSPTGVSLLEGRGQGSLGDRALPGSAQWIMGANRIPSRSVHKDLVQSLKLGGFPTSSLGDSSYRLRELVALGFFAVVFQLLYPIVLCTAHETWAPISFGKCIQFKRLQALWKEVRGRHTKFNEQAKTSTKRGWKIIQATFNVHKGFLCLFQSCPSHMRFKAVRASAFRIGVANNVVV